MLRIENISVYYKDVQALRDVSLEVPEKKIVALLGPNAAGKSTTLRTISGLVKARTGRITLDGNEIHNAPPHQIVELGIIQVPEGRGLFSTLTVRENLEIGAYSAKARPLIARNRDQVYSFFPRLREREAQLAGSLSGGEQQMCAIGRGLMALPKLLMLDEPSLGLAPIAVKEVFEIIHRIREQGTAILVVEQNVLEALSMADRGYVLENGSVVMTGAGKDLLASPDLRKAYLGL